MEGKPLVALATVILISIVALSTTRFGKSTPTSAQGEDRLLNKRSWRDEAVAIKLVKTKKGSVKFGEKFADGDDWFQGLTFKLENRSGKAITYIALGLIFRRLLGDTGRPLAYSIRYNLRSPRFLGRESEVSVSNEHPPIQPGESGDVTISGQDYDSIRSLLLQAGYNDSVKTIDIVLEEVIFADGSSWPKRNRSPTAPLRDLHSSLAVIPANYTPTNSLLLDQIGKRCLLSYSAELRPSPLTSTVPQIMNVVTQNNTLTPIPKYGTHSRLCMRVAMNSLVPLGLNVDR